MEVRDAGLQVPLVFVPGHTVHADGRRLLQVEERFGEAVFVDMVQQGGELERAAVASSFTHAA
jgi:hypothetical protein